MDVSLNNKQKTVNIIKPHSPEDRIAHLELQLQAMSEMFYQLKRANCTLENRPEVEVNADGIPVSRNYVGLIQEGDDLPYVLHVNSEGNYFLAGVQYASIEEATSTVIGGNVDCWTFWHDFSGKTLEELYR